MIDEARDLTAGERQSDYGDPFVNHSRIAGLWSAYLNVPVTAGDVAKLMLLVKVSRSKHRYHRDNYVDGIAYLQFAEDFDGRSIT